MITLTMKVESIPSKFTGMVEYADGYKAWYKDGKRHRLDGPAVELADGTKIWYKDGKRHRLDGPAVELADGSKYWFKDGKLHRLDGPAVEHADGTKSWYKDGKQLTEKVFNASNKTLPKKVPSEVVINGITYKRVLGKKKA